LASSSWYFEIVVVFEGCDFVSTEAASFLLDLASRSGNGRLHFGSVRLGAVRHLHLQKTTSFSNKFE
jgi:hypothetical protein